MRPGAGVSVCVCMCVPVNCVVFLGMIHTTDSADRLLSCHTNLNSSHEKGMSERNEFNVILLGDPGVGKSTVFDACAENVQVIKKDKYVYCKRDIDVDGETKVTLKFCDARIDRYATLSKDYYKNANCCFLCFDVTKKDSFDDLRLWSQEMAKFTGEDIVIIFVGNKLDLIEEEDKSRGITVKEMRAFAEDLGRQVFEVSAKAKKGMDPLLRCAAKQCFDVKRAVDEEIRTSMRSVPEDAQNEASICHPCVLM